MKILLSRLICIFLLVAVSACAPMDTRTKRGGTYGAAGGATAGAIVGQAIGHDTKGTLLGAAIGAAIGGLAGAGAGHYMDKQEQDLRQAVAASEAVTVQRQGDVLAITFRGDFLFDVDSSVVQPGAYSEIDRLARVFTQYPDTRIRIEGHTDSTGPEEYNLHLSQRRAEAVKQLLVSKVVYPDRMTAIGFGESRPKAGNNTSYGQQLNRRVEIFLKPAA